MNRVKHLALLIGISTTFWAQSSSSGPIAQSQAVGDSRPIAADFSAAHRLTEQGKYDAALEELLRVQSKAPATKVLSREFGVLYYTESQYPKAIASLSQAVQEDPDDRESIQLLGLSYCLYSRPAEAIPLLEKVQG